MTAAYVIGLTLATAAGLWAILTGAFTMLFAGAGDGGTLKDRLIGTLMLLAGSAFIRWLWTGQVVIS